MTTTWFASVACPYMPVKVSFTRLPSVRPAPLARQALPSALALGGISQALRVATSLSSGSSGEMVLREPRRARHHRKISAVARLISAH